MAEAVVTAVINFAVSYTINYAVNEMFGKDYEKPEKNYFDAKSNTKSQELPIPIVYGKNVLGGNVIYEKVYGENNRYKDTQLAIGEGQINSISEVKANDVDISDYVVDTVEHVVNQQTEFISDYTYFDSVEKITITLIFSNIDSDHSYDEVYIYQQQEGSSDWVYRKKVRHSRYSNSSEIAEIEMEKGRYRIKIGAPRRGATAVVDKWVETTRTDAVRLGKRIQSPSGINEYDQTFPYLAYLSIRLDGEELPDDFSSNPTVTAKVEGLLVDVWTGSTWTKQYSNNPAYCLLDLITNRRYGMGIDEKYIDKDSFIEVANYCDEAITDNEGNSLPRFQLDVSIQQTKSSLDLIKEILGTFRGMLLYSNGELRLSVDAPSVTVQSFHMGNIVLDSFKYWESKKSDIPNRVMVQYIDGDIRYDEDGNEITTWEKIYAQVSDESDIEVSGEVREKKVSLLGIKHFDQAGRIGKYLLNKAKFCSTFCEFQTSIQALHCEVGDIIKVSHDTPEWSEKLFRITKIEEGQGDNEDIMKITCQEYNPAIFNDNGVVQQVRQETTLPNPFATPASVKNLSVIEQNKVLKDGTWIPGIQVNYTRPDYVVWGYANIYLSADNGATWQSKVRISEEEHLIENLETGTYKVKVVSESKKGSREDFANAPIATITIKGKEAPPSKVNWGLCDFTDEIVLRWQPINDIDVKEYEIRNDLNWGNATGLIYKGLDLEHTVKNLTQRAYTFYIKALDRSGNYSEEHSEITVTNSAPPAPQTPKISEFFESIWIEIYSVADEDLKGYKLYITESDGQGNQLEDTEPQVIPLATPQKITYPADSGKSFLIECSAYDSLGEGAKSAPIEATTQSITIPEEILEQSQLIKDLQEVSEQNGLSITELENEYTVKIQEDINGEKHVTGFGLASEDGESEFAISADKFRIFGTSETGSIPIFAVDSEDRKVYILGDLIAEKTIKTKIANIQEAFIDSAQIIEVNSDKIKVGGNSTLTDKLLSINTSMYELESNINDFSNDNLLTLAEANILRNNYNQLVKESEELISQGNILDIDADYNNEVTNYETALSNLKTELNNWVQFYQEARSAAVFGRGGYTTQVPINPLNYPLTLKQVDRDNLSSKFELVQDAKSKLINRITEAREQLAKEYYDNSIEEDIDNKLDDYSSDNIVTKLEARTVRDTFDSLDKECNELIAKASVLNITTEVNNLGTSLSDTDSYLSTWTNASSYPIAITSTQRDTIKAKIDDVQTKKVTLIDAINAKIQAMEGITDVEISNDFGIKVRNGRISIYTQDENNGLVLNGNGMSGYSDGSKVFEFTNQGEIKDALGNTVIDINGMNGRIIKTGIAYDGDLLLQNFNIPQGWFLTADLEITEGHIYFDDNGTEVDTLDNFRNGIPLQHNTLLQQTYVSNGETKLRDMINKNFLKTTGINGTANYFGQLIPAGEYSEIKLLSRIEPEFLTTNYYYARCEVRYILRLYKEGLY